MKIGRGSRNRTPALTEREKTWVLGKRTACQTQVSVTSTEVTPIVVVPWSLLYLPLQQSVR